MIIEGMAMQGAEPTYCMGDDVPLPVLSSRPHALADYFKQRFAQVPLGRHPHILIETARQSVSMHMQAVFCLWAVSVVNISPS